MSEEIDDQEEEIFSGICDRCSDEHTCDGPGEGFPEYTEQEIQDLVKENSGSGAPDNTFIAICQNCFDEHRCIIILEELR